MRNPKGTARDLSIYRLAKLGVSLPDSLRLMGYSRKIQKLSEALCNGDWPFPKPGTYPGVVRMSCESCEASTASGMLKLTRSFDRPGLGPRDSLCPLCRAAREVRKLWQGIVAGAGPGLGPPLREVKVEVCRDGAAGLAVEDGSGGSSWRIAG